MITIENFIVDKVNKAVASLKTTYPDLCVVGDYIEKTEKFPCISVVESDNYTHIPTQDAALVDHAANVAFEINIFTNNGNKRKSTAKSIAAVVDAEMLNNLFTRTFMGQTPNVDRTIFRITMRYTAVVWPVVSGNNITYQMYRK